MASGKKNYFRHYSSASEDDKIQSIIDSMGFEGYAYYFILVEMCARKCSDNYHNPITFHLQSFRNVWRKQSKSCVKVLKELSKSGLFLVTFRENFVDVDIPNLSKYMGKYESKSDPNPSKESKGKESKEKKKKTTKNSNVTNLFGCIEDFGDYPDIINLLSTVPQNLQIKWIDRYQNIDWIKDQFLRMDVWLAGRPDKLDGDMPKFIGGWLARNHEKNTEIEKIKKKEQEKQDEIDNKFLKEYGEYGTVME